MNTILMVVIDVIPDEPAQMRFVEHDDVVQDLPSATSHPAFRDPILPRRLSTRSLRFQTRSLQKGDHVGIERRVPVQNHVAVWTSLGKGLTQLLDDPFRRQMSSHVEV